MNIRGWLQGIIGVVVTIVILIICITYFAVNLATRSHPKPYSSAAAGVGDSTFIYRNTFGIPHIVGHSVSDVLFSQGFVHAQDRLWQMDIWRRIGRGQLAEVMGQRATRVDVFMRALGIEDIAQRQYAILDSTSRHQLASYANGVSVFIKEYNESLPFEFDALNYKPEPWTPIDCLIVERVVAFELSLAFWNDIAYARIASQRGSDLLREYIAHDSRPPFVLDTIRYKTSESTLYETKQAPDGLGLLLKELSKDFAEIRNIIGINGSSVGSNCWALSRGVKGSILANDPHLNVSMPSTWYPNHLTADRFNVVGFSIPGLPFVISGRNDSIAWGVTNALIDDVDYFVEHIDPANPNYYFDSDSTRLKFQYRRDTIKIKNSPDSLIDLRYTNRSCIISDVHLLIDPTLLFKIPRKSSGALFANMCLSFRWTANQTSNEIGSLYRINSASSIDVAIAALNTWNSPSLNFHFADVKGEVSTVVSGLIPIRNQTNPLIPGDMLKKDQDWRGFLRLSDIGVVRKHDSGFVASANNKTLSGTEPFITTLYEPTSRIDRILQLLSIYRNMSVRDAQVMQLDIISPFAIKLNSRILPILKRASSRFSRIEKSVFEKLSNWDGAQSPVDPASAIHAVFLQKLIWNTFEDELGTQLFYDWVFIGSNAYKRIDELLDDPGNTLFDDIRTKPREDLSWIVIRSFAQTVQELRAIFESDRVSDWFYGKIHQITFKHIMGENRLLSPVMNYGPFEIGGSATTILNTKWPLYKPYAADVTQSMRVISDMSDSVQYCVLPGGVSGQPLDPHYSDQLQLWLKGGYVRVPTNANPDISFRLFQVFYPGG